MRILILTNNDIGLYKFRLELIDRLLHEHEVFISLPCGEFVPDFQAMGCHYVKTEFNRRGTNPLADARLIFHYVKTIRSLKPDVILTYTIKPNIYGGITAAICRTPCIANVTGLGTSIENGGPMQSFSLFLYRLGLKNARCVFFQNHHNRDLFKAKKIVSGKTRVIPGSGVNIADYAVEPYPDDKDGLRFLFIGRIMRDKGIEELLKAAQMVKAQHPSVTFSLIGDCDEDYGDALKEHDRLGIVKWLGYQRDVRSYIINCHCAIVPSYHEGTSNVLLESAATGRPVIATRIPGCMETFEEGVTGLGCNVRDADDLSRAIEEFISLPYKEKVAMGLAGRRKIEKGFDRQIVVDAYLEEIHNITG